MFLGFGPRVPHCDSKPHTAMVVCLGEPEQGELFHFRPCFVSATPQQLHHVAGQKGAASST